MPLRGPGPLTVFVPTNKAVDRSRDGSLIYMLKDVSILCKYICICFSSSKYLIILIIRHLCLSPKGQTQTSGASEAPYVLSSSSKALVAF